MMMAVMSMMGGPQARRAQFNREAILSATPVRLLTMLYDRLLVDLNRAEAAQKVENWPVASENLVHAQAIVSELSTSLNVEAWEGGEGLFAIYVYVQNALMSANVHRDVNGTIECIGLLEPLRQTWHEAAEQLPAQQLPAQSMGARIGGELGYA
jgi:flagellar secretion chaperone FliS